MTGNVVFFGFALSGVGQIAWSASLLAVAAFGAGAFLDGQYARTRKTHRRRLLAAVRTVFAVYEVACVT